MAAGKKASRNEVCKHTYAVHSMHGVSTPLMSHARFTGLQVAAAQQQLDNVMKG